MEDKYLVCGPTFYSFLHFNTNFSDILNIKFINENSVSPRIINISWTTAHMGIFLHVKKERLTLDHFVKCLNRSLSIEFD